MGAMCINNIRYADGTTLMELDFEKLQTSTNKLEMACSKWGMKITNAKCKIMTKDPRDITLKFNQTPIDKVEKFVFLRSNVPLTEDDVSDLLPQRLVGWIHMVKS